MKRGTLKLFKVLTKVKLFISKITSINYYNWHKSLPSLKLGVFSHSHSARLSRTSELNLKSYWSSCSRVAHKTLTHSALITTLPQLPPGCVQSLRVSVRLSTKSSNNTVEEQGSQEMGRRGCLIREEISLGKCQAYVNSL